MNTTLLLILSGFSIFFFSLTLIRNTLFSLYNTKIERILKNIVKTKFKSFLFGCVGASLIQSSSGLTAIAISLLSTKYINKRQCLALIIGANIGTCITSFIVAININNIYLYIIIIGFFLYLVFRKNNLFVIIFYIGIMLLGLDTLKNGFSSIINNPNIYSTIIRFDNSLLLSIIFGIFSTAIIQSSSSIISIVEMMYSSHLISLSSTLSIMLGANIGTTLTGYLSTINTSSECKSIIAKNLVFNLLGVLLFIVFFVPFKQICLHLQNNYFPHNLEMVIAVAHLVFNVLTVAVAYLFFDAFFIFDKKLLTTKEKMV